MLFEAVNMALLDEVNEELFLIVEAETITRKIIKQYIEKYKNINPNNIKLWNLF